MRKVGIWGQLKSLQLWRSPEMLHGGNIGAVNSYESILGVIRMKMKPLSAAVIAAMAGSGAIVSTPALAQNQAVDGTIETVVVTATRRAQDQQDVPLSVVAITAEGMEAQGIENMEDLNAVIHTVKKLSLALNRFAPLKTRIEHHVSQNDPGPCDGSGIPAVPRSG